MVISLKKPNAAKTSSSVTVSFPAVRARQRLGSERPPTRHSQLQISSSIRNQCFLFLSLSNTQIPFERLPGSRGYPRVIGVAGTTIPAEVITCENRELIQKPFREKKYGGHCYRSYYKKTFGPKKKKQWLQICILLFFSFFFFLIRNDAHRIVVGCRSLGCGALFGGYLLVVRVSGGSRRRFASRSGLGRFSAVICCQSRFGAFDFSVGLSVLRFFKFGRKIERGFSCMLSCKS